MNGWHRSMASSPARVNAAEVTAKCMCRMRLVEDAADVFAGYKQHLAAHGLRSRPWAKFVVICADTADAQSVSKGAEANVPDGSARMFQPWDTFVRAHSRVDAVVCPGRWTFGS